MKRQEKLKQATVLIQVLVPSIMELKKGCLIVIVNRKAALLGEPWLEYQFEEDGLYIDVLYEGDSASTKEKRSYVTQVLGREIHLEDVLQALNQAADSASFETNGDIYDGSERYHYNYSKPFTEQSEEFYNFIIDTLK